MRAIALLLMAWAPAAGLRAQDKQVINPPGASLNLPFSAAVRVGNVLYLSGQIGNVPGTRQLADTGLAGQTRQALEDVKAVPAAAGSAVGRGGNGAVVLSASLD